MRLRRRASKSIAFEAFGVAAEVQFATDDLETPVRAILPPGWRPTDSAGALARFVLERTEADSYDVTINGRSVLEHASLEVALSLIDADVRMLIATSTTDWIFVHAGVVAVRGRTLVIPGASFSGKTTLVRALVELGATYYSDEFAVLDADGMVHPYPRRLSIRSLDGSAQAERAVAELGGATGEERAAVDTVVLTRYRPGTDWRPQPISPGEGAVAMLANTVPAQRRPGDSLRTVTRALRASSVLVGDRGEAAEAASALYDRLDSGPR
ncbi:MAG TPA: hypothetical protein VGG41_00220 [Solirubrobacteraceae bacterium]|jgi:hypothetical protein